MLFTVFCFVLFSTFGVCFVSPGVEPSCSLWLFPVPGGSLSFSLAFLGACFPSLSVCFNHFVVVCAYPDEM